MLKKKRSFSIDYLLFFLLLVILVFLDQITKFLTDGYAYGKGFLYIKSSYNYGSSFGIFSGVPYYPYIMLFLSLVLLCFLFYLVYSYFSSRDKHYSLLFIFSIMLMIAGVMGNGIDRLLFLYVRDFIAVEGFFIFNLADFYLNVAVILFIIDEFFLSNNKKKE